MKSSDIQVAKQPQTQPTILIIEDERFISELYTRALTNAGYYVVTSNDGELALREAVTHHYDVILLDIMLPTMNGVDLLYKMKDEHVRPAMTSKIIITTNLDQKEETRQKIESMADGYLIKAEITPKELVTYVNQVIGRSLL
ncbi:MAG TPA: response regulator [Candidatus Saccharibacteria bacterium]|jgi:DNA-binding response OmpR family regulator|nr:response regulator [Candidatus Saccharibacteria bacterium]HMT56134.1 response regulator [Candidatus Saccharibacteria bacterium]